MPLSPLELYNTHVLRMISFRFYLIWEDFSCLIDWLIAHFHAPYAYPLHSACLFLCPPTKL